MPAIEENYDVRMSWAVLMKKRVFSSETFFCLCSMMIRNMILVTSKIGRASCRERV